MNRRPRSCCPNRYSRFDFNSSSSPHPFHFTAAVSRTGGYSRIPSATLSPAPEERVQLPHDEGVHLSGLEWFYFNGHLAAENGQEFSYHFVTFQTVQPSGLTTRLAQLSWADHAGATPHRGKGCGAAAGGVVR